jgi:putative tricarboxylic transport membrane protein
MTDTGNSPPGRRIRGTQDFVGGIALMGVAAFALWASGDLGGMRGFSFGAGTAPWIFAGLLFCLGLAIAATGLLHDGPALRRLHWRGPIFVGLALCSFALCIQPLGMLFSAMSSFLISALGSRETRWGEAVIAGACLTGACALLFHYGLGLPMPMLPAFLTR